ncbi:MAG: type II toxin-antitoxin system death-on-curing family toxin [Angustibacter sp.]
MSKIRYLTIEDALAATEAFLGGPAQVRDWGLLDSALQRPRATVFGEDAYPTLELKAAALLCSLVANHALVDGNKRLGWVCTRLFVIYNGRDLHASEDDAFELVMSDASHQELDVSVLADTLRPWLR